MDYLTYNQNCDELIKLYDENREEIAFNQQRAMDLKWDVVKHLKDTTPIGIVRYFQGLFTPLYERIVDLDPRCFDFDGERPYFCAIPNKRKPPYHHPSENDDWSPRLDPRTDQASDYLKDPQRAEILADLNHPFRDYRTKSSDFVRDRDTSCILEFPVLFHSQQTLAGCFLLNSGDCRVYDLDVGYFSTSALDQYKEGMIRPFRYIFSIYGTDDDSFSLHFEEKYYKEILQYVSQGRLKCRRELLDLVDAYDGGMGYQMIWLEDTYIKEGYRYCDRKKGN